MKRNVLIFAADFYPNNTGFANATRNLIDSVNSFSHEISFHVFTDVDLKGHPEIENVKVIRYRDTLSNRGVLFVLNSIKRYNFVKSYIIDNHIDFVLFETNTFSILQTLLSKRFNNIIGVRIHSTADAEVLVYAERKKITSKIIKLLDINFMKNTRYIISTNNYHLDFIKNKIYYGNVYTIWSNKDYFILPNTTLINDHTIGNVVNDEEYLLTMGKLSDNGYIQKGFKDLLKSIYELKSKDMLPSTFLLKIIGDGIKRDELLSFAKDLNVHMHVEFIRSTTQKETLSLIKNSKAIILLSRYEGQSMFITETLAMGKPVIITEDNGMKDLIIDGENGLVVNTGDYIHASEAILNIYNSSEDRLASMGKKSRELFDTKFSPKIIASRFLDIIKLITPH